MELEKILFENCKNIIISWHEKDIYAISFLVYVNENETFEGIENFPEFSIGYNTEKDCENSPRISEERWNYAFWAQNNQVILSADKKEMAQRLIAWYREVGVKEPGVISGDEYDENFCYIGRGPNGYYEFLMLAAKIAARLQEDGTIKSKFGDIPVIVHDLEYTWYCKDATVIANKNGQAADFIKTFDELIGG